MSEEFERDPLDAEKGFDPRRVSASRVNTLDECGVRFKLKYLDGVPEHRMGSFALFGSVVHAALEKWALNRSQDLLSLMRQAWLDETIGTPVKDFLGEYQRISASVLRAEKAAGEDYAKRNKGKQSKAPRMTKHFKESDAAKALYAMQRDWAERMSELSPWEFSERDPLTSFYDDSLIIAKRYARQYGHLPPALHTEFAFDIPWRGHQLVGHVDAIEVLINPETGELQGLGIIDYKTYRNEPPEFKDYRQLVMYDVAVRHLVAEGVIQVPFSLDDTPLYVGIDCVRMAGVDCDWAFLTPEGETSSGGKSRHFKRMTEADHDLLEQDLNDYTGVVEGGHFRPAGKGTKADFCDYGPLCCLRNIGTRGGCADRVEVTL